LKEQEAMGHFIEMLMYRWQTATMIDYAHCVIAIIVIGWFASRTNH